MFGITSTIKGNFTHTQVYQLEGSFLVHKYPMPLEHELLATILRLMETQVEVWFQEIQEQEAETERGKTLSKGTKCSQLKCPHHILLLQQ